MNPCEIYSFGFSKWLKRLFAAVSIMLTAACSIVEVYSESRYFKGSEGLPAEVFDQIKPGVTTKAWVLDYLGSPAKKMRQANGEEHWLYPLLIEHRKGGRIILLYSGMAVEQEFRNFHLLFNGKLVSKAWYSDTSETLESNEMNSASEVHAKQNDNNNMAAEPLNTNPASTDTGAALPEASSMSGDSNADTGGNVQYSKKSLFSKRNGLGPKR